jgi:hypothetical protein
MSAVEPRENRDWRDCADQLDVFSPNRANPA